MLSIVVRLVPLVEVVLVAKRCAFLTLCGSGGARLVVALVCVQHFPLLRRQRDCLTYDQRTGACGGERLTSRLLADVQHCPGISSLWGSTWSRPYSVRRESVFSRDMRRVLYAGNRFLSAA